MTDEDFNAERVEAGRAALISFSEQPGQGGYVVTDLSDAEQFLTVAGDLIANLMHCADAAGVDTYLLTDCARLHYAAETTTPYDLP